MRPWGRAFLAWAVFGWAAATLGQSSAPGTADHPDVQVQQKTPSLHCGAPTKKADTNQDADSHSRTADADHASAVDSSVDGGVANCNDAGYINTTRANGATTAAIERPLPDAGALMHAVETNQRAAEAIEKDYIYKSVQTEEHSDGHGGVKKTETREFDIFWVEGVPVQRMTKKDGKELSESEQKKENESIDKEVAKAKERRAKADAQGKETSPRGDEEITVSRMLELASFTNSRRVQLNGRDTIAIDFAGDPKAKTKNRFEDVIRDLVGTIWIDEQDRVLVKLEGHFLNAFKIGGGLLANIQKGTNFRMEQRKINDEVWLPALIEGQGEARALLLFKFDGSLRAVESDYRKFKATSTILPGVDAVDESTQPK